MARTPARHANCPRCDGRLARDNDSGRCAACQAAERDRLISPPTLPTSFWDHEPIRRALTERHLGRVIRAYRCHPYHGRHPLPQEAVARWLGITQAQLSRVENGPAIVHLDRLTHWAQLLRIPAHHLWFKLLEDQDNGDNSAFTEVVRPSITTTRSALDASAHAASPAVQDVRKGRVSREADLNFMRSLRSADRRVGGGHLYATVTTYLAEGVTLSTSGRTADAGPKPLLAAAASLNEMAGWMAHDAGAVAPARIHLSDALALARRSGDQQLAAQACASLSHLACHHGNANDAVSHARDGLDLLQSAPPNGRLKSRLLAMQARGLATAGRPLESANALAEAEVALQRDSAPASEWLSPFDNTSFAIEAARCFLRIGDLSEAQRRLQDVLVSQPADRVRSRAFAQLMLVTALLGKGQVEEACVVTRQALGLTAGLGSAVIVEQLQHVTMLLRSQAKACIEVPPLLNRLHEAIRERSWIGTMGALRTGAPDARQPGGG